MPHGAHAALPPRSLTFLLAALVAIVPFAIDTYLPAMAQLAADLQVNLHQAELSISAYLLGSVPGYLVGGPVSDRYGRRLVGLGGLLIYVVSAFSIAFVDEFNALIALRFIQAFGAGFAGVIVSAVVRDLYEREEAARVFALIGFIMMGAPLVAPLVGTGLLHFSGWRSIFLFLTCYGGLIFILLLRYLPHSRNAETAESVQLKHVLQDYWMVIQHRPARGFLLAQIFCCALLFMFLTQVPFLVIEQWGFDETEFPLFFISGVISIMIANRVNSFLLRQYDSQLLLRWGLKVQTTASVGFLLAAWLAPTPWFMAPTLVIMLAMLGFIFSNGTANYMHFFPEKSGTANALSNAAQYLAGAFSGALISWLYNGSSLPLAVGFFVCALLALLSLRK